MSPSSPQNNVHEAAIDGPTLEGAIHDNAKDVLLAFDLKSGGHLGCSYYASEIGALCILEDVALADEAMIDTLMLQVQPTTVLTPIQIPGILSRALSPWRMSNLSAVARLFDKEIRCELTVNTEFKEHGISFRTLNLTDFSYHEAREKLIDVISGIGSSTGSHLCLTMEKPAPRDPVTSSGSGNIRQLRAGGHIDINNIHSVSLQLESFFLQVGERRLH